MVRPAILVIGYLIAFGVGPQLDQPLRQLRVEPSPIVWIEAGTFVTGANRHDLAYAVDLCMTLRPINFRNMRRDVQGSCAERRFEQEGPQRSVWTAAYGIDRTEVTHRAWRTCVAAGRCAPSRIPEMHTRLAAGRLPVSGVTWPEARRYCAFVRGRLPTEEEWERAARGSERNRFPWGRQYNSSLANHGRSPVGPSRDDGFELAAPVGSFPDGASPYGLLDVAGNVWEWTESNPRQQDVGFGADPRVFRVIRGGSWNQPPEIMRVTHRVWVTELEHRGDLGFRCAYDRPSGR